eukprot:TRINITY_DN3132_c0_g4_i1.p1 TRINITY_DN3132_c0_g4~~TRINITY_DN3132_c0_g4_i1.p1  ORF type:complete len:101 (+),score=16.44 TRINITY_DN3132_c0_g4_i1:399-701(+)
MALLLMGVWFVEEFYWILGLMLIWVIRSLVSPLYISCQQGHSNVAKILLDHEADVNICKNNGVSPLFVNCEKGYVDIAQMILDMVLMFIYQGIMVILHCL